MSFEEITGQDRAVGRLKALLKSRRIHPALLLRGPEGTGKRAAALAFAAALHCGDNKLERCGRCAACDAFDRGLDPDLHRVDAAYQASLKSEETAKQRAIKVETVRYLMGRLEMRSSPGRWKIAIIEDAHLLVPAAANALLKALEEPPPLTVWILVTHRPADLLPTVRSRCQDISFSAAPGLAFRLDESLPDPSLWIHDPMAPIRMAEGLPRELHLQRPLAARHLRQMTAYLRNSRGVEGYTAAAVRTIHRELADMQRALEANADPRLVVEIAALRLQQLDSALPPPVRI